jgi:transposase-like protein
MAASDAAPGLVNLSGLMDDAKCFAFVRQHRWPEGVRCPECDTAAVIRDGCDDSQPHRQRYRCKECARRFDDLTGTVFAGHHQPLRVWVLCLMGANFRAGARGRPVMANADAACISPATRHAMV